MAVRPARRAAMASCEAPDAHDGARTGIGPGNGDWFVENGLAMLVFGWTVAFTANRFLMGRRSEPVVAFR